MIVILIAQPAFELVCIPALPRLCLRSDVVDGLSALHAVPGVPSAPQPAGAGGETHVPVRHRPARRHAPPHPAQPAAAGRDGAVQPAGAQKGAAAAALTAPGAGEAEDGEPAVRHAAQARGQPAEGGQESGGR